MTRAQPMLRGGNSSVQDSAALWNREAMEFAKLRMDAQARILDVDLQPIRRLYGAGGTIGGYTNEAGYRSGWHLTNAFAFGFVAGKNIAAEKPWA